MALWTHALRLFTSQVVRSCCPFRRSALQCGQVFFNTLTQALCPASFSVLEFFKQVPYGRVLIAPFSEKLFKLDYSILDEGPLHAWLSASSPIDFSSGLRVPLSMKSVFQTVPTLQSEVAERTSWLPRSSSWTACQSPVKSHRISSIAPIARYHPYPPRAPGLCVQDVRYAASTGCAGAGIAFLSALVPKPRMDLTRFGRIILLLPRFSGPLKQSKLRPWLR